MPSDSAREVAGASRRSGGLRRWVLALPDGLRRRFAVCKVEKETPDGKLQVPANRQR
jgi:hypothetical protein